MKTLISIAALLLTCAAAQAQPPSADISMPSPSRICGAYLDDAIPTFAIEEGHLLDFCAPIGTTIKIVRLGDPQNWKTHNIVDREEIDVLPREAGKMTNMIVTAFDAGGAERRYEIRLVSIEASLQGRVRVASKPAPVTPVE